MVKKIKKRPKNRPNIPRIEVVSDTVIVAPYSHMQSYFHWEVAHEGLHRKADPIVAFPKAEAGTAIDEWISDIFEDCDWVRGHFPKEAFEVPGLLADDGTIDVGLIDIRVTFKGRLDVVHANLVHQPRRFMYENLIHIDAIWEGTFHDQMNLVTCFHGLLRDGSPCFHHHNLVFAVRREVKAGQMLVAPLDLRPMLDVLKKRHSIGVVSGLMRESLPTDPSSLETPKMVM